MDWRRAKSVLILAFLLLNALLGYQLWTEWRAQVNTSVDWTSLSAETRQIMQEKKIRVDSKIPAETPAMRDLSFQLKEQPPAGPNGRTPIAAPPETRIVFNAQELTDALGRVIPALGKYVYDDAASREGVFVLNRTAEGFPMFDIHLELYYSEQKIRSYRQDVIEILSSDVANQQQVLPASTAVAHLIRNYLPANSAIKEIRLGYHSQIFPGAETQVSAPSWRVLLENGEVYYVHAVSAEVTTEKGDAPLAPLTAN
jgi:regulatory protein YycI of two-component signal transduction system YycFG